ncbi:MAG: UDP-3-O-(3-hydroxymyristoyl)glucosamine N-acyltransferase [Verrucomicrobiaceae bacterium]|nr:UDP-3-O-(3-hydroxymyristoyl)glucosamine N-acyltransferase [Verrucomicrobiaceae bacterium]
MKTSVGEIAALVEGELVRGDAATILTNFAALDHADESCVSFYGNPKYREQLRSTRAGLVLVPEVAVSAPESAALVVVENPVLAFDSIVRLYGVTSPPFEAGVHQTAFVHPDARLDPTAVSIAAKATVAEGAVIGKGTRIGAGAAIGGDVVIGEDCVIAANVTICQGCLVGNRVILHPGVVVGADGFGFEFVEGRHRKIEQLGIVRIGDDVEIGASSTIDRARFGETVIGEGTKIDNQVQIGHNCIIGKHCIVVAQTGISGSTRIGDYVTLAAQCGIAGHLVIADRVTCGGRTGVIASIREPGGTYFGYPARPFKEGRREAMRIKQLGSLFRRVKALESGKAAPGDEATSGGEAE